MRRKALRLSYDFWCQMRRWGYSVLGFMSQRVVYQRSRGSPGRGGLPVSGCHGGQADGGIIADGREGLKTHVAALHRPLVVLLKRDGAD